MKFKTWLHSRTVNWKEEYLPPLILTAVGLAVYLILALTKATFGSKEQIFFYIAIIWLPALFYTLFYLRLPPVFKFAVYIFATCSNLLATGLNVYAIIPFFDTVLHTLFGYLGGYIGLYLLIKKKDLERGTRLSLFTILFFCFAVVGTVGVLWEVCEYTADVLFGGNTQHAIETGIVDTMQDQFCNLTGGLVFVAHYLIDTLFVGRRFMTKMEGLLSVHADDKPCYRQTAGTADEREKESD